MKLLTLDDYKKAKKRSEEAWEWLKDKEDEKDPQVKKVWDFYQDVTGAMLSFEIDHDLFGKSDEEIEAIIQGEKVQGMDQSTQRAG